MFLKIILIFAGIIVLLVVFFFAFPYVASIFSKDIAPIDDSDLQLSKVNISDSENAYFDLIKLEGNVDENVGDKKLSQDIVDNKIWDQEYVDELLKKNKLALTYFDDAAKKLYYQDPVAADPKNYGPTMVLPSMNTYRQIARISAIKAENLSKNGQYQDSLDEVFKIIGVGDKIQKSQGTLIHFLTGLAVENIGLRNGSKYNRKIQYTL